MRGAALFLLLGNGRAEQLEHNAATVVRLCEGAVGGCGMWMGRRA
jgi:hypothetical protein